MQDIMEEKVGKVFMIIRKTPRDRVTRFWFAVACMVAAGCSSDFSDDPIPPAAFPDIHMNLNLSDNLILRSKGNSRQIEGGVRGIIVYCADVGVFRAYERNCSFHPNDACATVNIDVSTLFMTDPCCGSTFDFNTGNPMGGAAWRPLRQYRTSFDGTVLLITDEVVE